MARQGMLYVWDGTPPRIVDANYTQYPVPAEKIEAMLAVLNG